MAARPNVTSKCISLRSRTPAGARHRAALPEKPTSLPKILQPGLDLALRNGRGGGPVGLRFYGRGNTGKRNAGKGLGGGPHVKTSCLSDKHRRGCVADRNDRGAPQGRDRRQAGVL